MKENPLRKFIYLSIAAAIVTILLKFYAYYVTGSMGDRKSTRLNSSH